MMRKLRRFINRHSVIFFYQRFHKALDSIISDWDFNKAMTRDIQVDLRYILWNMKHVDHADNLLKEMNAE